MAKYPLTLAKSISYGGIRALTSVFYIPIHYTGNKGDTAKNNVDFFANGNIREAGAHFFVDQVGNVHQSIPMNRTAWAVGLGGMKKPDYSNGGASLYGKCTSSNSVSIELCDCATKDPSPAMIKAVKELVAHIQKSCPNAKTICRHWDVTGKECPKRMIGTNNKKWEEFKKAITGGKVEPTKVKLKAPESNLKKGSKGEDVKRLQLCINYFMGAKLDIDGSFGPATEKALKSFQKKYKLTVDGSCGPKTRAKLKEVIA